MINIDPKHVTLAQLIQGRLFRIPQYQRTYSWHSRQRQEMFGDIQRIHDQGKDRSHFMATVVGLRRQARTIMTEEHHVVEIVDGQQRITTLILLLKAITEAIDSSDAIEERIGRQINHSLVKDDEATLLLLQTNHDGSNYFANYLRHGTHPSSKTAETIADRELLSAMEDCEQFVADWQHNGKPLESLVTLLRNRLTFIFHEISDEALVYTVFEVLNSRGLDVSSFDRLKSMLMAIVFESETGNSSETINEVHQLWAQIYRRVGLRLGLSTESLRFAATLRSPNRPNRTLGEEDAVGLLYGQSKEGPKQVIATTKWLKDVTDAVDELAANRRRNAVTRIGQARMVAASVHLRQDFTEDERAQILHRWERVTFRIYGMFNKDARTAVGDYVRLAWCIWNESLSADEVLKRLSGIGRSFPVDRAVEELWETDCYTDWKEELRYFLYKYEEHLAVKAGQNFSNEQWDRIWESSPTSSIEHIRPQSWWTKKSSDPDLTKMHGLGNLMMLPPGLNAKLQDKPPSKKIRSYTKTGLLAAQEVSDLISERGWSLKVIAARKDALLKWARLEWAD